MKKPNRVKLVRNHCKGMAADPNSRRSRKKWEAEQKADVRKALDNARAFDAAFAVRCCAYCGHEQWADVGTRFECSWCGGI